MLGNPKFNYGDTVSSYIVDMTGDIIEFEGTVEIIDRYGTFEQNEEVSYDVMVDNWCNSGEKMFVKHLRESNLTLVKANEESRKNR